MDYWMGMILGNCFLSAEDAEGRGGRGFMDYWMGMILGNCFLSAAGGENCQRNGHDCWTIMWAPGLTAASRAAIRLKV